MIMGLLEEPSEESDEEYEEVSEDTARRLSIRRVKSVGFSDDIGPNEEKEGKESENSEEVVLGEVMIRPNVEISMFPVFLPYGIFLEPQPTGNTFSKV